MEDKNYEHIVKSRMDLGKKIRLFAAGGVVLVLLTIIAIFLLTQNQSGTFSSSSIKTDGENDLYRDHLSIGTRNIIRGNFKKIEQGVIYLETGRSLKQVELADEISLRCSTQSDLSSAKDYYLDEVTSIEVVKSHELNDKIPVDSLIVIFVGAVDDSKKVYAVVKNTDCPSKTI